MWSLAEFGESPDGCKGCELSSLDEEWPCGDESTE